jgi:hypothetical protein
MSYEIDSIEIIDGELSISREAFAAAFEEAALSNEIPEISVFHRDDMEIIRYKTKRADGKKLEVVCGADCPENIIFNKDSGRDGNRVRWRGAGSGSTYDTFKNFLSKTKGNADLVLIWEGGDSVEGLRVRDGVVTSHSVGYVLRD